MSYVLGFAGLVALVQSTVWLSSASKERVHLRARVGMLLAPLGTLMLGLGLAGALIPGFWE